MTEGWTESAGAWIAYADDDGGGFGRRHVLDGPMLARVRRHPVGTALDVGCGEGRFCRQLAAEGIRTVGIDPTEALVARARELDPDGDYRLESAEALSCHDAGFDLVVSYLTLIDIDGLDEAAAEMTRVLKPGGRLLIANLNPFQTSGLPEDGWITDPDGTQRFFMDRYFEERAEWVGWSGIRIRNWHRPMSRYFSVFVENGLVLSHFDEPRPTGGGAAIVARYNRVPFFHVMEWQKPSGCGLGPG